MKLFRCLVNDGRSIYEAFATGKNKKTMLDVYGGNGTFEKIEDVTKDYFTENSVNKLMNDLELCGWGKAERTLITALLEEHIDKTHR